MKILRFKKGDVMLRQKDDGTFYARYLCVEDLSKNGIMLWALQSTKGNAISWEGLLLTEVGATFNGIRYMTNNGVCFTIEKQDS